jgi:hypothetical protein
MQQIVIISYRRFGIGPIFMVQNSQKKTFLLLSYFATEAVNHETKSTLKQPIIQVQILFVVLFFIFKYS